MRGKQDHMARRLSMILVGVLVGVLFISPAGAHFVRNSGHLAKDAWKQVIRKKVFTKAQVKKRFITKSQANNRFITSSQANNQFVTSLQLENQFTSSVQYIRSGEHTVPVGTIGRVQAICPEGWFATGGGGFSETTVGEVATSFPSHPGSVALAGYRAWTFEWRNNSLNDADIRAYVVCVKTWDISGNYDQRVEPIGPDGTDR